MKMLPLLVFIGFHTVCGAAVRTGLERVDDYRSLFEGKRVGIIANHTACDRQGRHIVEVFDAMEGVEVTALFSPEHGLYGTEDAGARVEGSTDPVRGLPVYSLYGKTLKPTAAMLEAVDVLVFDIQDVGARFYTYTSTMSLAMEAAAETGKRFVVLDRPNPITGLHVEGPLLEPEYSSFVGLHPIPVRHGMTIGELAQMFNGAGWLEDGRRADLAVVPMTGWSRELWYEETGLGFIRPSPNIPDIATAAVYPGICLLEGTNISEGRGTDQPFLQFGAPWLDSDKLEQALNALNLPGMRFAAAVFTPTSSKHRGQECRGVRILLTDRDRIEPFWAGVLIVNTIFKIAPEQFEWRQAHFDRLCGTATVREAIILGTVSEALKAGFQAESSSFEKARKEYLIYPESGAR
ncbi:MAG TPA: DUF1343 domain-containing protein [Verrucomicrobia bacterium]|jgi:uncharacterized protein YbbC (DUF1343 family)|nr:DUF1343 domain-containing protein [Verrucomicrobiota bacterium]